MLDGIECPKPKPIKTTSQTLFIIIKLTTQKNKTLYRRIELHRMHTLKHNLRKKTCARDK
jgi:hypothetical protein